MFQKRERGAKKQENRQNNKNKQVKLQTQIQPYQQLRQKAETDRMDKKQDPTTCY